MFVICIMSQGGSGGKNSVINWELLSITGLSFSENTSFEIDLSSYNTGIYLVKIANQVFRIVKE